MNRAIPDEIVEQVRVRADIIDVIQSYIPLKKAGQSFKACCPFHQERTPSFTVNPIRQSFHCFGCGKGGDVFRFVMERENVDFPNAIHILARKYGVHIPDEDEMRRRPGAPAVKPEERHDFKERLYQLHEKMREWFSRNLSSNPELSVSKYLATRKLPEESVMKFGLGASLDSWDAGAAWARREGFTDQELVAGGLLVESSDHPGRFYDRFRNRLMFPIWNEQGRVVGFSARTVEAESFGGKYVNSPETPIFKKSRILYGLHFARNQIGKSGFALLCEGQLDVIAMHRAGFENSVAPQGTAFTEEQAHMLKRYCDTLLLALDSDAAGQKALLKCAEVALPAGFAVKVVQFPSGKDPDELLKTVGREAIAGAVDGARDFFEFLFDKLSQEFDISSPSGKAAASSGVLKFIGLLEGDVARASYISWLAGRMGLDQAALLSGLERQGRQPYRRNRIKELAVEAAVKDKAVAAKAENTQVVKAMADLLMCLMQDKAAASKAAGELGDIVFTDADGPLGKAVETVIQATINGEWEDAGRQVASSLDQSKDCSKVTALLAAEGVELKPRFLEKTVDDCLRLIRVEHAKSKLAELMRLYLAAPDGPEREALAASHAALSKYIMQLNSRKNVVAPKLSQMVAPPLAPVGMEALPPPPPQEFDGIPEDIVIEEEQPTDFSHEDSL